MINLLKVIEANKGKAIERLINMGCCISMGDYKIYDDCESCTNKCKDCINGKAMRGWLMRESIEKKEREEK